MGVVCRLVGSVSPRTNHFHYDCYAFSTRKPCRAWGSIPLGCSAFCHVLPCVPVSWSLWRRVTRTRRSSIGVAQAASFLILFFGSLLLVPGAYLAFAVFGVSWFTLNAAAFAWCWFAGD